MHKVFFEKQIIWHVQGCDDGFITAARPAYSLDYAWVLWKSKQQIIVVNSNLSAELLS